MVAARELEELGFRVLQASGGAEALADFRESAGDITCVLLDVTMPGMNGEEVFRALRELRDDVPVLFMSGHSSKGIDERLTEMTGVGRLRKPFRLTELAAELRTLLGEDRSVG